jgi:hypothetical protein
MAETPKWQPLAAAPGQQSNFPNFTGEIWRGRRRWGIARGGLGGGSDQVPPPLPRSLPRSIQCNRHGTLHRSWGEARGVSRPARRRSAVSRPSTIRGKRGGWSIRRPGDPSGGALRHAGRVRGLRRESGAGAAGDRLSPARAAVRACLARTLNDRMNTLPAPRFALGRGSDSSSDSPPPIGLSVLGQRVGDQAADMRAGREQAAGGVEARAGEVG